MYSKAKSHFLRISINVLVIRQTFDLLEMLSEAFTDKNIYDCYSKIEVKKIIDIKCVMTAEKVLEYFLHQKLYMTGYVKNINNEFYYFSASNNSSVPKKFDMHKKILLSPNTNVYLSEFRNIKWFSQNEFNSVCNELESKELGTLKTIKRNNSQRAVTAFVKNEIPESSEKLVNFIESLKIYNVGVGEYNKNFPINDYEPGELN